MTTKTIKVSEDNYRWLLKLSNHLQKKLGKPISIDKAITLLHAPNKKNIMDLAGKWKISDQEAEEIFKDLSERWKKWKISV